MTSKNWKEIQKEQEQKYKKLIEARRVNDEWFVICRKHARILAPFKWDMTYEQIDEKLKEC